jgi:MinD superfamily P-loop ATPase
MTIAIASGKGGTGKTTLAPNLARTSGTHIQLQDCDVEEPNAHLFLMGKELGEEPVTIPVPVVDDSLCDGCGECARICEFNAIASFGTEAMVFPELCHGCSGCFRICPRHAIEERDRRIGVVRTTQIGGIKLIHGHLDVGTALAPPLIRAVRAHALEGSIVILDAPPGTSCPVVAAVRGADYVVLVTEPTPFGLNDLKLAVAMARQLALPFGVVVNRAGSGDRRIHEYCEREYIEILSEIPDDRRIAEAYSRGILAIDALPEYRPLFLDLFDRISSNARKVCT